MLLLINPPNPPDGISNKDTMGGFGQVYDDMSASSLYPLDMLYIASVMKKNSIDVKIYDCAAMHLSTDELIKIIKAAQPKILGVRTSTPTANWDISVIEKIKKEVSVQVVVFGPHATLFAREIIDNRAVDAVVLGEPEYAFLDLVNKHWDNVEGIIYKRDGKIHSNESIRIIDDLDALPFPAWDMVSTDAYSSGEYINNQSSFFTMITSRGCPFVCTYCPYPVSQGKKWRSRSEDNVVDEIQYLMDNFGMKALLFRDPEFTLNNDRVMRICQEIIKRGLKFSWRCETRVDTVSDELLTMMAKAGCVGINFGIESINEKILATVGRKSIAEKDIIDRISTCKSLGIKTFCFFIIGFPDDDAETIMDNINFSLKLQPDYAQFTVYTPYYGTELYSWYVANGFIEDNASSSLTSYKSVVRSKKLTMTEIQKFRDLSSKMWEMTVKLKAYPELAAKAEHLNAIKATYWYKISYGCYSFYKRIRNFFIAKLIVKRANKKTKAVINE